MAARYENAFVYIMHHPQYGIWMGATPELLLEKKEYTWHTVSLAGTQAFQAEKTITWSEKLKREQQLVTSYITDQLGELGASVLMVQGPYTAQAGPLSHLKTDISFTSSLNSSAIIEKLQPTPAVCGLPRDIALAFIAQNCDFERRLYAGRLGIVKANGNEIHFVNLRCMQVFDDHFELHVGGGIVAGSTPEDEWRETEMKADVLRSILH
jgi:isochorismate synthase